MSSAKPLTARERCVERMLRDHAGMGSEALCIMSAESAAILRLLDAERAAHRETREAAAEDDRKHLALAREIGKILDPQQALSTAALAASRYQRRLDAAEARVQRLEEALLWYETYDPQAVEQIRSRSPSPTLSEEEKR